MFKSDSDDALISLYLFLYLTDPSPIFFSLFLTLTFAISFELSKTVAFERSSNVKFSSTEVVSFNHIC